jgi:hypothetical protein
VATAHRLSPRRGGRAVARQPLSVWTRRGPASPPVGRRARQLRRLPGYTSIATTGRYTAVDDDEIRAAAMAAAE